MAVQEKVMKVFWLLCYSKMNIIKRMKLNSAQYGVYLMERSIFEYPNSLPTFSKKNGTI